MTKKTVYVIGAGASYEAKLFDKRIGLSSIKKQIYNSENVTYHSEGFINKDIKWALEIYSRDQGKAITN